MKDYQPTSRRPIADIFRKTAHRAVTLCVKLNIHPDIISYSSIVASVIAALCFWQSGNHPILLLVGPAFCYLRLWFNMLDGMVALASGKASLHGEIINEFPDRISDVLIFAGVAHSGINALPLGYLAAIFSVLTAYVGIFGQAVGVQREFSGWMSKQWRMVALHIGAWAMWGSIYMGNTSGSLGGLTVLDWTLIIIVLGCVQTIWVRLSRIMKSLREKAS